MSAQVGGFGAQGRAGPNRIQATLVGLVDSKEMHNNLIQALRAWSGNKEQKLLHRESVFKLPQAAGGTARPDQQGYELRVRLGKSQASGESPGWVQPMSLLCLGDSIPFPQNVSAERMLRSEDTKRKLPKPALRKVYEVEVGQTCDEMLKLMGFELDYQFMRHGLQFHPVNNDRCTILVSEMYHSNTGKLEVNAYGEVVNDVYLVEVVSVSAEEQGYPPEALTNVLRVADKLAPFVALNNPDDRPRFG